MMRVRRGAERVRDGGEGVGCGVRGVLVQERLDFWTECPFTLRLTFLLFFLVIVLMLFLVFGGRLGIILAGLIGI